MIKTFSYRVKDATTSKKLSKMSSAVNAVWNYCNETQKLAAKAKRTWLTAFDLNNLTAGSSKELGLHSQTIQAICEEYASCRDEANKPWLNWRSYKKNLGWIPFKAVGVKLNGANITCCKKKFRFWLSRPIEGQLKTGSFSQDARGRWYVNFQCEAARTSPTESTEATGIDLGFKEYAVLSNGEKIENPRHFRALEEKSAAAQRAGKKKQAKTLHAKIANSPLDFLHKLSTKLVTKYGVICVGNVSSQWLAKTNMAKSVYDAGWGLLRTFLAYKAIARQVKYIPVPESYSTQTCVKCDALTGPKGREELDVREWLCSKCGTLHDRDVNSAQIILRWGHPAPFRESPPL
jgi:putative transposase